jgi:hypothetical protein
MKSTRHVDIKTQAVAPESGVKPVVPCGARLEARWARSIPELDIVVAFPPSKQFAFLIYFVLMFWSSAFFKKEKCLGIFPK